jgi:hypothetical protein
MKNLCLITFIFIFTLLNEIIAQDFSGKYLMQTGNGELVLLLEHKGGGNYGGSISGNGNTFLLQGSIQNRVLQGTTGDDLNPVMFIAELNGGVLTLVMAETDAANQPVLSTAQTLVFHYQSAVEDADSQDGIIRRTG